MAKYLVQQVSKASTARGKNYLRLRLFELGGKAWNAVWWEDKELPTGVVIDALAEESEFAGQPQLTIKAARVTNDDPSDLFLPKTQQSVDGLFAELLGFIDGVVDRHLRGLLILATNDPRWRRAPAAMKIHHAYLGGLLEHTVNLCRLVNVVAPLYPAARRDLLITAAVLHDVGKLEELTCGVNIEYSTDGQLLGHIIIGLLWVDGWMTELDFPGELRRLVRHLIISHHGAQAYGSPKPPQLLEAQLFTALDGLDAGMGAALAVLEKAAPDAVWTEETNKYQKLYLGER